MKKLSILLLLSLIIISCTSNEEKAEKLIKKEFYKTLYDFESYSPIETTVIEAKQSVYTDSAFFKLAQSITVGYILSYEYANKAIEANEQKDIWGKPSRYSSLYSDNKYYKYKQESDEYIEKCLASWLTVKELEKNLKDTLQTIISDKVVGWEVTHKFRCRTKGGHASIGNYRFVMDKDFKNIILHEDMDDEHSKKMREVIQESLEEGLKLK